MCVLFPSLILDAAAELVLTSISTEQEKLNPVFSVAGKTTGVSGNLECVSLLSSSLSGLVLTPPLSQLCAQHEPQGPHPLPRSRRERQRRRPRHPRCVHGPLLPFLLISARTSLTLHRSFLHAGPALNGVLALDSTESSVVATVNTQPETCAPTGTTRTVQNIIINAVKNLKTDLVIQSVVKLDDYQTPLDFVQRDVATVLDPNSVLYLTTILGPTIVSSIVDGTVLSFTSGQVYQITDSGFKVDLVGSLANAGPFDALIEVRSCSPFHLPRELSLTY